MNGDMRNRNPGFAPGGNMAATLWNNNHNAPPMTMPPPDFSIPPPNLCGGGFPRFSGPLYNQPTFQSQRGRMPSPRMNVPPSSYMGGNHPRPQCGPPQRQAGYVNDDIFGDAPAEVPCGFPFFNPCHPPPMPRPINVQSHTQVGMMRGGGRGFHGNQNGASTNRGRGGFFGKRPDEGLMNRGGGQVHKGRGMISGPSPDGFQKKKKPRVDKRELPENNVFFCDICDRGFKNEEKYQEHVDNHQKCSFKDCPFVAAPKLVQLHMSMQHRGGMAKKIWSVESEEDINKWREERKKNFPTAQNIQKRKERMEERVSRGEVIETKDFSKMTRGRHRGRGNRRGRGRFNRGRGKHNDSYQSDEDRRCIVIDDDDDGPPEEIKIQRSVKENAGQNKEESCVDDEGIQHGPVETVTSPKLNVKTGLSLLTGYGSSAPNSDDDDTVHRDQVEDKTSPSLTTHENRSSDKNESHTNLSISSLVCPGEDENSKEEVDDCRHEDDKAQAPENVPEDQNGKTGVLSKSPSDKQEKSVTDGSHVLPQEEKLETENKANADQKTVKRGHMSKEGPAGKRPKYTPKPPQKSYTLLEKLLSKEIRRERNKILQCIHFVVKNKFFDNTCSSTV